MLPGLPFAQGKAPLGEPEEFTLEMSAVGYNDVTIHTVTHRVTTQTMAKYWQMIQRSAVPMTLLRRNLGEERWAEVANSAFNKLHETLGDGPIEEIYTIHLGVGTK